MADVLLLDSSVLRQLNASKLRGLAGLARRKGVRIVVHAHIHLEYCRHLRGAMRARGIEFTPSTVRTSLDQLGIEVAEATLDRDAAEAWASLLDQRYPDDGAWQAAKLDAVKARLPEGSRLRASGVPMTTDWLVALEVERQGARVAVRDSGPEWDTLRRAAPCRALSYPEAVQWLEARADALPSAPSG
jgi:hypothetical protein